NLSGGVWTALRMPELIRARHEAFHTLVQAVDGIVALREWGRNLLVRHGGPASKIALLQHAVPGIPNTREPLIDVTRRPLRVAFLGRAAAVKGADTLVKAVRAASGLNIELHLYGVTQGVRDETYWTALKSLAAQDARITFCPSVPHD